MSNSIKSVVIAGCLGIAVLATAACSPRPVPPMTVTDLMEDRVSLDGVLMKCNQNESKARTDADCVNARIAVERLASQSDAAEEAKHAAEFERRREQLRLSQDRQRQEEEAKNPKVDAYHLPLVPVEPPPPPPPPQPQPANDASPPVARESNQ
jgi:uncharacterized protein YaiL (DUF2058 family)